MTDQVDSDVLKQDAAERLKAIRAHAGASQKDFAAQLCVSGRGYQKYEDGDSLPGFETLRALHGKGYNVNWLLSGDGPMLTAELQAPPVGVDSLLLEEVIRVFHAWIEENKAHVRIAPTQHPAVIAVLYRIAAQAGKAEKAELEQVLRLAA